MTAIEILAAANTPTQKSSARPCPACGSAVLWIDPYGNPHCLGCDPPAAAAMVRRRVVIQHGTGPGGTDCLVDVQEVRREREEGHGDAGGVTRAADEHGATETQSGAHAVGPPPGVDYAEWWAGLPDPVGLPSVGGTPAAQQGERFALTNEPVKTKNSRKGKRK